MTSVSFSTVLDAEFRRRRSANPRYSLRAFALAVGKSHSALSRLRNGRQRASDATVISIGRRLGWTSARMTALIRDERIARLQDVASSSGFVPDARWIASRANLTLDAVQLALQEAVRSGRLEMNSRNAWTVRR